MTEFFAAVSKVVRKFHAGAIETPPWAARYRRRDAGGLQGRISRRELRRCGGARTQVARRAPLVRIKG
jgi:hypothetical protein